MNHCFSLSCALTAAAFLSQAFFSTPNTFALKTEQTTQIQFTGGGLLHQPQEGITASTLALEAEQKTQTHFSQRFRFQTSVWGSYDSLDESTSSQTQLELDEGSLSYQNIARRLKVGFSYRSWEGTDLVNPMNVFTSDNLRNPLKSRKRSGLGVFYDDAYENFDWEFTYIARQQKPLLPEEESPWWPRSLYLPTESEDLVLRTEENLKYKVLPEEELNHALSNNFALRVQYHGDWVEVSLGAMEGLASTPILSPLVTVAPIEVSPREIYLLKSPVQIQPIFYRQRALAGRLVWTLEDVIFRLSANHVNPLGDDDRLPSWSELYVGGIEKTFYFSNQTLTLLAQYIDSRRPGAEGLSLLTSLYEKSFMLGSRWAPGENWSLLLALFQETQAHSSYFRSELNWRFRENWNAGLEGNFFQGPPESVLGTYTKNDSLYFSLKRIF